MHLSAFLGLTFLFGLTGFARAEPSVAIETSMGTITLELDRVHAPKTVDNFLRYVGEGHYDGTLVYRVAPGFVIQAGSYDSATNSRTVHDPIPLEAGNGLTNQRGTIAMARQSDPGSATAEFFINLADNANLDRQPGDADGMTGYAVFGRVIRGMDVVDKIAAVPVGAGGPMVGQWPQTSIVIQHIRLLGASPSVAPPLNTAP
jgi:peptidyl-prolyl cis-trans isomerase A (cyclophilin A)/peptidyl-prolyl cis-trans isomerase B (cyclophilin B)